MNKDNYQNSSHQGFRHRLLDDDHPDILDFIASKSKEAKKTWALIDSGYDGSFEGEAYESVFFQNANHSVRLSDKFLHAVQDAKDWNLINRTNGEINRIINAKNIDRSSTDCLNLIYRNNNLWIWNFMMYSATFQVAMKILNP